MNSIKDLLNKGLKEIIPTAKIDVVQNGVDIKHFRRIKTKIIPNSIIFIGGLTWYPNTDAVFFFIKKVWPILIKKINKAKFTIGPATVLIIESTKPNKIMAKQRYMNARIEGR